MNLAAWYEHLSDPAFWGITSWQSVIITPTFLAICMFLMVQRRDKKWTLNPYLRTGFIVIAVILNVRYLVWRTLFTINRANSWAYAISLILLVTEIYAFFSMLFLYLQSLWPLGRKPVPFLPEEAPDVDVYVTMYNEPEEILKRTLSAVTFMDYPADRLHIYVLDDGHRPEIKKVAADFDVGYLTREGNKGAKAGNINHALPLTSGEIIVIFDCDHVPVRSFLQETIGYFKDEKVAIVQTPHNFYNLDVFQRNLHLETRLQNEQDFFYNVILPGRNRFNSVFFAGTTGLIRRTALEQAGGFRITSLIEDMFTSMELHSMGWKSIYHYKVLSGALAAETFSSFMSQHKRWTRGAVQIFVLDNPFFKRGLTFMQRLHYFGSLLYFLHGPPRIVYLAIPLPFLFYGISPIVTGLMVLLGYFIPFYLTTQAALALLAKRYRNPFWSDMYETSDCFAVTAAALGGIFNPVKLHFHVTEKKLNNTKSKTRFGDIIPHMILIGLLLAGLAILSYHIKVQGTITGTQVFIMVWTLYNIFLLRSAASAGLEVTPLRKNYRLSRALSCEVLYGGALLRGKTVDISDSGVSMLLNTSALLPVGTKIKVKVVCACGETLVQEGVIAWQKHKSARGLLVGMRFVVVNDETTRQATRIMFSCRESWEAISYPVPSFLESILEIIFGYSSIFNKKEPAPPPNKKTAVETPKVQPAS